MNLYFQPDQTNESGLIKMDALDIDILMKWINQGQLSKMLNHDCFIRLIRMKQINNTKNSSICVEIMAFSPLKSSCIPTEKQKNKFYPFGLQSTPIEKIEQFFCDFFQLAIQYKAYYFEDALNKDNIRLEFIFNSEHEDNESDQFEIIDCIEKDTKNLLNQTHQFLKTHPLKDTIHTPTNEILEQIKQNMDKLKNSLVQVSVLSFNAWIEASRLNETQQSLKTMNKEIHTQSQKNQKQILQVQIHMKQLNNTILNIQSQQETWTLFIEHHKQFYTKLIQILRNQG